MRKHKRCNDEWNKKQLVPRFDLVGLIQTAAANNEQESEQILAEEVVGEQE